MQWTLKSHLPGLIGAYLVKDAAMLFGLVVSTLTQMYVYSSTLTTLLLVTNPDLQLSVSVAWSDSRLIRDSGLNMNSGKVVSEAKQPHTPTLMNCLSCGIPLYCSQRLFRRVEVIHDLLFLF